jgi:hypothetical protein
MFRHDDAEVPFVHSEDAVDREAFCRRYDGSVCQPQVEISIPADQLSAAFQIRGGKGLQKKAPD